MKDDASLFRTECIKNLPENLALDDTGKADLLEKVLEIPLKLTSVLTEKRETRHERDRRIVRHNI
jgi:hypothetical protein